MTAPLRLASTPYEKVWGSPLTEPWYRNPERRNIGEVWFKASESVPLLVKLLFTSERLSIQVHPDDDYARKHENSRGKTEMWHILRAEPDARICLGPLARLTPEQLRETSLSGKIEHLLRWVPAHSGDTFFAPAGTIHALGGGLVLCEVQQLSDITYRLYDYGRGRQLHLDHGVAVASFDVYEGRVQAVPLGDGSELLAECKYFRTERLAVNGSAQCREPVRKSIYVVLEGEGSIAGSPFQPGEAWEISPGSGTFQIESRNATFLITSEP